MMPPKKEIDDLKKQVEQLKEQIELLRKENHEKNVLLLKSECVNVYVQMPAVTGQEGYVVVWCPKFVAKKGN